MNESELVPKQHSTTSFFVQFIISRIYDTREASLLGLLLRVSISLAGSSGFVLSSTSKERTFNIVKVKTVHRDKAGEELICQLVLWGLKRAVTENKASLLHSMGM